MLNEIKDLCEKLKIDCKDYQENILKIQYLNTGMFVEEKNSSIFIYFNQGFDQKIVDSFRIKRQEKDALIVEKLLNYFREKDESVFENFQFDIFMNIITPKIGIVLGKNMHGHEIYFHVNRRLFGKDNDGILCPDCCKTIKLPGKEISPQEFIDTIQNIQNVVFKFNWIVNEFLKNIQIDNIIKEV